MRVLKQKSKVFLCIFVYLLMALPSLAVTLVNEGKAEAVIVIPSQPLAVESYAAKELQYHIKAASGVDLQIITEDKNILSGSHIYLGNCKQAKNANIDFSKMPGNAFTIKTVEPDIFIIGKDNEGDPLLMDTLAGTLFGVYDFLETNLGVKWLWPGELGEVIPASKTISISNINRSVEPSLWFKEWRNSYSSVFLMGNSGYSSNEKYKQVIDGQNVWLRRQRFGRNTRPSYGHAFTNYWERFGKTHPEYFSMLPDGTRRPEAAFDRITMCVSQPGLWNQIIEDWKVKGSNEFINVCENDALARCVSPECLAWDVPDPDNDVPFEKRLDVIKKLYAENPQSNEWIHKLGSLSDRYARYAESVRQEAAKIRPDVKAVMYAYDNYRKPPIKQKLNENILVGIVPQSLFPYNKDESISFRKDWGGWASTSCSLFLRPNYTLQGHNFPVFYARTIGEDLKFALSNSMKGVDFDGLTGQWAAQGPTLYTISSVLNNPNRSVDSILDEYYDGFGPAKETVKAYFKHWEDLTSGYTYDQEQKMEKALSKYGVNYASYDLLAVDIYSNETMAKGESILAEARLKAANNPRALARIEFLTKGLKHAKLTLEYAKAYKQAVDTGDHTNYYYALKDLLDYRKQIETDFISGMVMLTVYENFQSSRQFQKLMSGAVSSVELNGNWKFNLDSEGKGEQDGWNRAGFDVSGWSDAKVAQSWIFNDLGKSWKEKTGKDYAGTAWYKITLPAQNISASNRLILIFRAIDGANKVWVDGKQVFQRADAGETTWKAWRYPEEIDITDAITSGKPAELTVKVSTTQGPGGINLPVWLIVR